MKEKLNYLYRNKKILVAVSGGIDSMFLLHVFAQSKIKINVLHVNYGLRDTANHDQKIVEKYCRSKKIPIHIKKVSPKELSKNKSFQSEARKIRYTFFENLRKKLNFDLIATAHHTDDWIETLIMRFFQGTSFLNLKAFSNPRIIRPLLFFSKNEIVHFVQNEKIPFGTDETNFQLKYKRNYYRNHLLPMVEKIEPSYRKNVVKMAKEWSNIHRFLENEMQRVWAKIEKHPWHFFLPFNSFHENEMFIFFLFLENFFTQDQIKNVQKSCKNKTGNSFFFHENIVLNVRKNGIFLFNNLPFNSKSKMQNNRTETDFWLAELTTQNTKHKNFEPLSLYFDARKILLPLHFFPISNGLKIKSLGMKHSKKVFDICTDKKIPKSIRQQLPAICDNSKTLIAVGWLVSSDETKITFSTEKVYRLKFTFKSNLPNLF